jgi:trigger factor
MQVSVETPGGLQRRMKVEVPAERLEQAVEQRLQQWSRKAKLPGFRPGKVPFKVLQQQFGEQARQEAMSDIVQATYVEALQQTSLSPAGNPRIEFGSILAGQPLSYTASFEVYPEIQLKGLDGLTVEKPAAEVSEADIDRMVENLREQRKTYAPVERAAAEGDQVNIDFSGTVNGEPFAGNSGENVPVIIGSGRFLKQMEDGLVGRSSGEDCEIVVDFPADYPAEALKGKQAVFKVKLRQVAEPRLPELNEAFFQAVGVKEGGNEALRGKIRDSLGRERDRAVTTRVKQQVLDGLLAANMIELPQALVGQETGRMRHEALHRLPPQIQKEVKDHPEKAASLLPDDLFQESARKRVALGLLIAEVIRARGIQLDATRVNRRMEEMAGDYERADEVLKYYRANREIMQGIEAMVMEEQVVESLLAGAKVTEKPMDLDALLKPAHGEAGHVHGPDCDHDH